MKEQLVHSALVPMKLSSRVPLSYSLVEINISEAGTGSTYELKMLLLLDQLQV